MRQLIKLGAMLTAAAMLIACGSDSGEEGDSFSTDGFAAGDDNGGGDPPGPVPEYAAVKYPAGPYGTEVGSRMASDEFLGWYDPMAAGVDTNAFAKVRYSDFYDPDGEKGIKLILINASAVWCGVCRAEYDAIRTAGLYEKYRALGVEFVGGIFEDVQNNPSKPTDLANWSQSYEVAHPMVLDPSFKMGRYFTGDATPMNLIVDARSMTIVRKILGGDVNGLFAAIDQELANQN